MTDTPSFRDAVLATLREDGWPLADTGDGVTTSASVEGESGRWIAMIQVFEPLGVFVFYSLAPVAAPAARRAEVLDFLTRANSGMLSGNFEFDSDSGDVRYKTTLDLARVGLDRWSAGGLLAAVIRDLAYTNATVMDRYLPGLLEVGYGGASAADALAAVEGGHPTAEEAAGGSSAHG